MQYENLDPFVLELAKHHPDMIPDDVRVCLETEIRRQASERGYRAVREKLPKKYWPETQVYAQPLLIPRNWRIGPGEKIKLEVAEKYRVTVKELEGVCREKWIVPARQEAMFRMCTETDMSLPQIGKKFGNRDHTTVLHAYRTHAKRHGLTAVRPRR